MDIRNIARSHLVESGTTPDSRLLARAVLAFSHGLERIRNVPTNTKEPLQNACADIADETLGAWIYEEKNGGDDAPFPPPPNPSSSRADKGA